MKSIVEISKNSNQQPVLPKSIKNQSSNRKLTSVPSIPIQENIPTPMEESLILSPSEVEDQTKTSISTSQKSSVFNLPTYLDKQKALK